jgi:glycosyltransferase involved in cell wall biosynthesis
MSATKIKKICVGINLDDIIKSEETTKSYDAVMIGLRPNKGLYDIIPVWEEVLKLRPDTTLLLMGGMSGHEQVFEEIRNKGLDKYIKLPEKTSSFIEPDQFYKTIKTGRTFFAPSHEEGWGIALCEAMACGLPVVAYNLTVYDRIYGGAFSPVNCFNTKEMAKNIVQVLDDELQYNQLQKAGIKCSEKYDWGKIADDDLNDVITITQSH